MRAAGRDFPSVRGRTPFASTGRAQTVRTRGDGRNRRGFSRGHAAIGVARAGFGAARAGFGAARTAGNYAGKAASYGVQYLERRGSRGFISKEVARGRMTEAERKNEAHIGRPYWAVDEREAEMSYLRRVQEREAMEERAEELGRMRRHRDPVFERKVSDLATKILESEISRNRKIGELVAKLKGGVASQQERKYFSELVDEATKEAMKRLGRPVAEEGG